SLRGEQIPSRRHELLTRHTPTVVERLRIATQAIRHDTLPDQIAITLDDRVRLALLARLVRIQRRVNATVHDPGAAFAHRPAHFVAAQRIARVDPDADDVTGGDR